MNFTPRFLTYENRHFSHVEYNLPTLKSVLYFYSAFFDE